MSMALDRIVATLKTKHGEDADATWDDLYWSADDCSIDVALSLGDLKDAINVELHELKSKLDALAGELEYAGLFEATAKLREPAKDL